MDTSELSKENEDLFLEQAVGLLADNGYEINENVMAHLKPLLNGSETSEETIVRLEKLIRQQEAL